MHPRPRLTTAEADFLRVWIWEEANFQRPHTTTAKKLQVERCPYAAPQLADIVAAAMTPEEQAEAFESPAPTNTPPFPWSTDKEIEVRHREAKAWLEGCFAQQPRPAPGLGKGSVLYIAPDFDEPLEEFAERE